MKQGKDKSERQLRNNFESGQILILVLFFFGVAVVIAVVLAAMWHAEIQMRSLEKNSLSAFYLAQAGIEEAKACVENSPSCSSLVGTKSLGAGRYNFNIAVSGTSRNLTATGEVLDNAGNIVASKRIEVWINNVTTTPVQSPSSWKEM